MTTAPRSVPAQDVEDRPRCFGSGDPLMAAYHDEEWGVPQHDDRVLFEHLILDIFQAGLSWRTILYRRQAFRRAFHGFDPERMARYRAGDRARLLADPGIVRNAMKIDAAIANARAYLRLVERIASFDEYLWSFTGGQVLHNPPAHAWHEVPTTSREAAAMSRDLRSKGFRFVGATIGYAFMQAVGMVDDHLVGCFRYARAGQG